MSSDVEEFAESPLLGGKWTDLENMRKKNDFTEIYLQTKNGTKVFAHGIILAARLPNLRENILQVKGQKNNYLDYSKFGHEAVEAVVSYAYTGKLKLNRKNVESVMEFAKEIGAGDILDWCCTYLVDRVTPTNLQEMRSLATRLDAARLEEQCDNVIKVNFELVYTSSAFLSLPETNILQIIESTDLVVNEEDTVFKALMKWVYENENERVSKLPGLLSEIRWNKVRKTRLLTDLDYEDTSCRKKIEEIGSWLSLPEEKRSQKNCPFNITPRVQSDNVILLFGELNTNKDTRVINAFDPQTNKVQRIGESAKRDDYVVVSAYGKAYIIGGALEEEAQNLVEVFDPNTARCRILDPMIKPRVGHACGIISEKIIACGGDKNGTCEIYDINHNKWKPLGKMEFNVSSIGIAILPDGRIFILGQRDSTNIVRYFSVDEKVTYTETSIIRWNNAAPMLNSYSDPMVSTICGKIFINGSSEPCFEIFTPPSSNSGDMGQWTQVGTLCLAYHRPVGAFCSGSIYVFYYSRDEMECFHSNTGGTANKERRGIMRMLDVEEFKSWIWTEVTIARSLSYLYSAAVVPRSVVPAFPK